MRTFKKAQHSTCPKQGGRQREREGEQVQFNDSSCCHLQDIHGNTGSSLSNYFTHKQEVNYNSTHTHMPMQAMSNSR